jgi:hypothetical protein
MSVKHNVISILFFGSLLPFMIYGFWLLIQKRKQFYFYILSSLLVYHTLIHVAFIPYTRDRYRHPVDFIVIIVGLYGIFMLVQIVTKYKKSIGNG